MTMRGGNRHSGRGRFWVLAISALAVMLVASGCGVIATGQSTQARADREIDGPEEWSLVGEIPNGFTSDIAVVADSTVVSGTWDEELVVWVSDDPLSWDGATKVVVAEGASAGRSPLVELQLLGDELFLLNANQFWTSDDGLDWQEGGSVPADHFLFGIARTGTSTLLYGSGPAGPVVWPLNGEDVGPGVALDVPDDNFARIIDVAAGGGTGDGGGFVAFGRGDRQLDDGTSQPTVHIWYSPDGTAWEEADLSSLPTDANLSLTTVAWVEPLGRFQGTGSQFRLSAAPNEEGGRNFEDGRALLIESSDGLVWELIDEPLIGTDDNPFLAEVGLEVGHHIADDAELAEGLVLIGYQSAPYFGQPDLQLYVWSTKDGQTWQRVSADAGRHTLTRATYWGGNLCLAVSQAELDLEALNDPDPDYGRMVAQIWAGPCHAESS